MSAETVVRPPSLQSHLEARRAEGRKLPSTGRNPLRPPLSGCECTAGGAAWTPEWHV